MSDQIAEASKHISSEKIAAQYEKARQAYLEAEKEVIAQREKLTRAKTIEDIKNIDIKIKALFEQRAELKKGIIGSTVKTNAAWWFRHKGMKTWKPGEVEELKKKGEYPVRGQSPVSPELPKVKLLETFAKNLYEAMSNKGFADTHKNAAKDLEKTVNDMDIYRYMDDLSITPFMINKTEEQQELQALIIKLLLNLSFIIFITLNNTII